MSDFMTDASEHYERAIIAARQQYAPVDQHLPETLHQLGIADDDTARVTDLVLLFAVQVDAPALDDAALAFCRLRALLGDDGLDGPGGLALGRWLVDTTRQLQVGGHS